jgi:hypothetical protein
MALELAERSASAAARSAVRCMLLLNEAAARGEKVAASGGLSR